MTILSRILSLFRRKPAPKCVDCAFCDDTLRPFTCGHDSARRVTTSLVVHDKEWEESCSTQRAMFTGACGPRGRYFEPRGKK